MNMKVINTWHQVVNSRNLSDLKDLLADNVIFHSPVVHTPQEGKAITLQYLTAAFGVLFNDTFRYEREIVNNHDAALEFSVEIEGVIVNGVDMIRWDENGRITDFKVMLRPLKAINLIHQMMAARL